MQIKVFGFTLIELVLVLVIIGLLSAVAIPRYIEVNSKRELSEKQNLTSSVKSALVIARADIRGTPNVSTLASYVQNENVMAISTGIQMQHRGESLTVPTYVDTNCTNPTKATHDMVKCVGDIP